MDLSHSYHKLRNYFRQLKKRIQHHEKWSKLFQSKNARLAIILIITAAIPLTVLGVQQIQDIRQNAAVVQACDASKLLNANPRPAIDGQEIVFSHTDGPITENMFQEEDFTGNGAKECKLDATNGWIRCKAKYNDKSKDPISSHTWTFRGIKCKYQVQQPAKKPKDTTKPGKGTPGHVPVTGKPTSPPKPNEGFDADLEADGCNASKIPRLKVKWDATSGKVCTITLKGGEQEETRNTCNKEDLIYDALPRGSSNNLKSKTPYKLTVTVDGKGKEVTRETAECIKLDKTPTLRPGQATPTLKPGEPTPVPGTATCKIDKAVRLDINQSSCSGINHKISGAWKMSGPNCVIELYKNGNKINQSTECNKESGWSTHSGHDDIEPGAKYQLKAKSDTCTTIPSSNEITAKACVPAPTRDPSVPGADVITPCPGGFCP